MLKFLDVHSTQALALVHCVSIRTYTVSPMWHITLTFWFKLDQQKC